MSRTASPLRYPGGKACLYDLAIALLSRNGLKQCGYAEPYSGGCGLALNLLFNGYVSRTYLNDLDRSVWAFWYSILNYTDSFISLIDQIHPTVEAWERQREIQSRKSTATVLELGFSTFFLNRTNRSGIIHSGGLIGGRHQSGEWKMSCRYNREELIQRIRRIAKYRNRINLYNEDAEFFFTRLGDSIPSTAVLYIDPPYFVNGSKLYRNSYMPADHERIADKISRIQNPWFLTYDNVPPTRALYRGYPQAELNIGYSAQTKRLGSEILVLSRNLCLPP